MDNVFLSGGLAFLITFFSIPAIIEVTQIKKLFDQPNPRKVHKALVPTLGGIGIFAGFVLATLIGTPPATANVLQYFMAASLVIFFLGVKDDIIILSASKKFIGQLLAASIIIKFGGIQITNMYGFLGIHELPYTASILLTLFTIIVVTNSFNLIDGVDGLAGSLGILTCLIFGFYFHQTGHGLFAVMAFSMVGSLAAFLIYNIHPARIFMGDTGSLLIGLVNSILVIKFINTAGDPTSVFPIASAPAIGFAILIVPLFDTLRVVTIRIIKRRSPFSPDRNHIHHFLLDLGFTHTMIAGICLAGNIAFIALAYYLRFMGTTAVMLALSAAAILVVSLVYYSRPSAKVLAAESVDKSHPALSPHKVITLTSKRKEKETSAV